MAETLQLGSPLDGLLEPGVHATAGNSPGLSMEERRNVVQLQLLARNNSATQLADAMAQFSGRTGALPPMEAAARNGLFICATGPQEYWILAEGISTSHATKSVQDIVGLSASVFDQGAGRFVIRLAGRKAVDVLAKGTSLDLHPKAFPAAGAGHTVIEHIPALVARHKDPVSYDISVPRSYAASFVTWLRQAASEYGYVINDPGPGPGPGDQSDNTNPQK